MLELHKPKLYGRRLGRKIRVRKSGLIQTMLPRLAVTVPEPGASLDPVTLFGDVRDVWLEVGFGGGEHLAEQSARHPDIGFIGCEPFLNGVASLLDILDSRGLGANVRVLADDARPLLDALAEASVGRCFVLFPDPWPKKRHHERRFIGPANLDRLARVMRDGAELRLASDVPDLAAWMAEHVQAHPAFEGPLGDEESWRIPPPDWVRTRYEQKGIANGRAPFYFVCRRRPRT